MRFMKYIAAVAAPLALAALLTAGAANIGHGSSAEAAVRLESALRRAIASEYAVTGAYPESLDPLLTAYGIKPDKDRFKIFYEPVAENIPPSLTVLDLEAEREAAA